MQLNHHFAEVSPRITFFMGHGRVAEFVYAIDHGTDWVALDVIWANC